MEDEFELHIPPAVTTVFGVVAAVLAAVMAYSSTQEGVEILEEKTNDIVNKAKRRMNKKTPPAPAE